jgi:hypothetical protein
MLSNSTWNVVAVHNHVVMESPKMMFVHATGMSDINTLTSEAKMVLDNLASLQQTGSAASNNGGSPPPSGAEQGPGPGQPTNQDQSASD